MIWWICLLLFLLALKKCAVMPAKYFQTLLLHFKAVRVRRSESVVLIFRPLTATPSALFCFSAALDFHCWSHDVIMPISTRIQRHDGNQSNKNEIWYPVFEWTLLKLFKWFFYSRSFMIDVKRFLRCLGENNLWIWKIMSKSVTIFWPPSL